MSEQISNYCLTLIIFSWIAECRCDKIDNDDDEDNDDDIIRRSLRPYGCKAVIIEPGAHNTQLMARNNFRAMFERAWNQTSSDIKEEFGEEYFKFCENLLSSVYSSN